MISHKKREAAAGELIQAIGLLVRRVRVATANHELSLTERAVVSRLEKEGPLTTAELARAEGMKPQSMGATVAALKRAGLVVSRKHPTDGRQVHLELSAKGQAVRKHSRDAKRSWLTEAIGRLDKDEQAKLFAAGQILQRLASTREVEK